MAGYENTIAKSVSFGIGSRAEALTDIALQLEAVNSAVNLVSYDFVNDLLVFKASIPQDYVGTIYEVGIYSQSDNPTADNYGSRNITTFDSATENWLNLNTGASSNFNSTNTRIGVDSLFQAPNASSTEVSSLANLSLDFSGNFGSDTFNFAFNVGNTNTSQIQFKFLTDSSNYYYYNIAINSAGYQFVELTKASAGIVGNPDWVNITEIQVATTSNSTGPSSVQFDAIRIENKNLLALNYILVARKVLASPVVAISGQAQDIEFSLSVNI